MLTYPKKYDTVAAAKYIGARPGTLRNWRSMGRGPAWVNVGSKVYYLEDDLRDWLSAQRVVPQFA